VRAAVLSAVQSLVLVACVHGQNDARLRERVATILAQAGDRPLPSGDTLVEFAKQGPILYYTIGGTRDSVTSSMVRNDGLVGWATSQWSRGRPTAFSARWADPQGVKVDIRGEVVGPDMRLHGGNTDHLVTPELPWAVADYGMDDHLVPLLRALPRDSTQAIAVWRPFGQKWDTLSVRTRMVDSVLLVSQGAITFGIAADGRLLMREDREQAAQRRPLEGNARFAEYRRIAAVVKRSR